MPPAGDPGSDGETDEGRAGTPGIHPPGRRPQKEPDPGGRRAEKQSQILKAEAEKETAILLAEAEKEKQIREAEGQAQAIMMVQKANADALKLLSEANPSMKVLTLKSYEALTEVANGRSTDHHPERDPEPRRPRHLPQRGRRGRCPREEITVITAKSREFIPGIFCSFLQQPPSLVIGTCFF